MIPRPTVQDILEKSLFELLDINSIPDEKKQQLLQKMSETVEARVFDRLYDQLSETDQQTFKAYVEGNHPEELDQLLQQHEAVIRELIGEEVARYRLELVALLHTVTQPAQ